MPLRGAIITPLVDESEPTNISSTHSTPSSGSDDESTSPLPIKVEPAIDARVWAAKVLAVAQRVVLQLPRRLLRGGDVLRVHYQGYTGEYTEK